MSRLPWVWASPPDEALSDLCRELEAGVLPAGREVIKENRIRSVWRIPDLAGGLLLKHYRLRAGEGLKTRLLGGRAEREYRAMESLCRVGLPSARPVAFADRRESGRLVESWFLSGFVPDSAPLSAVLLERAADSQACLDLAEQAVRLVAQMHRHPFLHRDLHAGNLLLDSAGELIVIDMHSLWHVLRLTNRQRWDTLARLVYSMRETVSLDAAPQLAAAYARERGDDPAAAVRSLSDSLGRFAADYVRGRTDRCMRSSTEFVTERLGGRRVHRRREYDAEMLSADISHHQALVESGGPLLGDARAARVSRVDAGAGPARVVKHYRRKGPLLALRSWFGRSRARGAWIQARRCEVHGVPTPRALALAEEPGGAAWVVTTELTGATSLREILSSLEGRRQLGESGALARALGHVVGRLSRAGLRHDDLSAKNVMVAPGVAAKIRDRRITPGDHIPDVQLIDLDGMRTGRPDDDADLTRMLAQLGDLPAWITRTDRQRFASGFSASAGRGIPCEVAVRALSAARARRERREARLDTARPPA
jgi:tRNA A-37 threonylcarbamoyl transferase component Bud32